MIMNDQLKEVRELKEFNLKQIKDLKDLLIKRIDENLEEYKQLIATAITPQARDKYLALENELMDTRAKAVALVVE